MIKFELYLANAKTLEDKRKYKWRIINHGGAVLAESVDEFKTRADAHRQVDNLICNLDLDYEVVDG